MASFSEIPWIAEHIELYRTDPDKAHMWDSSPLGGPGLLPTLLLTTTGRKSGEPRVLPLIYGQAGDGYVIIASKGGMPNHPIWYLNLEANPDCELMVGSKPVSARARTAEVLEKWHLAPLCGEFLDMKMLLRDASRQSVFWNHGREKLVVKPQQTVQSFLSMGGENQYNSLHLPRDLTL